MELPFSNDRSAWPLLAFFWGKTRHSGASVRSYPLVAHALDVAAVAQCLPLPDRRLNPSWIGFLASLHDVGKFSRAFQGQVRELWPAAVLGNFEVRPPSTGPRHDVLTLQLLDQADEEGLFDLCLPAAQGWGARSRAALFRPVAGHHGRPVELPEQSREAWCDGSRAAAWSFIHAMLALFQPVPLSSLAKGELKLIEWRLAGFLTLADWIGSREDWFPEATVEDVANPALYFHEIALPRARQAVAQAHILPAAPRVFGGLSTLFPAISQPSPLQAWAQAVPLPGGPCLAVLEDMTGSGKTEAAMILAARLMAAGQGSGLFFALPTMATANGIFERLRQAYRGLFAEEASPSLALAHGRAQFNAGFRAAIAAGRPAADQPDKDGQPVSSDAECAAWLAEDRRRTLLADCGVGTIDQALLAILPVRQAPLRLYGLSGKILIIDEAHAFDSYMRREMQALLRFHAALGGSAILLSATLPQRARQSLVDAFRHGLGAGHHALDDARYPLATLASTEAVKEQTIMPRPGFGRAVRVTQARSLDIVLARVAQAARLGAAVVWVRNSVDDALEAADALRAEKIEPLVFHARFALVDRLAVEAEVSARFGRASGGAERGRVLVATQVVEQSLDLDFDLLCTDLAPADSLIQRAGRLWRHQRGPRMLAEPEMIILSPAPVADAGAQWLRSLLPRTDAVYRDPALLWRSARAIFETGRLTTPDDMRRLIEASADESATPPGLQRAAGEAEGRGRSASAIASQNVLSFEKGYTVQSGAWEPETATPTRLEDRPQVTLRLAREEAGVIKPYATAGTLAEAWSLSEVTVALYRLSACPVPDRLTAAAAATRASWGRWEKESSRMLLAVVQSDPLDTDGFVFEGQDGAGEVAIVSYRKTDGLVWGLASKRARSEEKK